MKSIRMVRMTGSGVRLRGDPGGGDPGDGIRSISSLRLSIFPGVGGLFLTGLKEYSF